MKRKLLTLALSLVILNSVSAQPGIQWQVSLGGSLIDQVDVGSNVNNNFVTTSDGGLIIAGHSYSNDGDVTGHHGLNNTSDYWIVKLDSMGNLEWQKSFGGSEDDVAKSIYQTQDGGYIVGGESYSDDGDVTGHHDSTTTSDVWVIKLDAIGNIEWQNSYGGSNLETCTHIEQTSDGGYIFTGDSQSSDGDVSVNKGAFDFWVVKLNSLGIIQWEKSLGGSGADRSYNLCQTSDGGFVATGITSSNDSDITFNAHPGFLWDIWVVKLDSAGNKVWDKCYGGTSLEWGFNIKQTADTGFVLCATTASIDDDIVANHGGSDIWIAKLDAVGNIQWSKCYGGSDTEMAKSVSQLSDGGYLISGTTRSSDGDVSSLIGNSDCWIVKTDSIGAIEWEKTYGGTEFEGMSAAFPAAGGGYFFVGESGSNDVDVSGHHGALGDNDIWAVKLSPITTNIVIPDEDVSSMVVSPNPISSSAMIYFNVNQNQNVKIDVIDIMGKKVKELVNKRFNAGKHFVNWDAYSEDSNLSSGTYFIQITMPNRSLSQKVILLNK